ncbi:hypothetical protein V6N13_019843 [Hibiscus sabdariffa]|uniref:S-protein homolog n=2 Tax=Hibiscus sabdariffa TaxID=183260 RepID=A0ABR1ZBY6_9ROSI
MGDYTNNFFVSFPGSDVEYGSRWCESRSRPLLGYRTVRLDRSPLGRRNLCRLLCQGPGRVLIFVDWYGVLEDDDKVNGSTGYEYEWKMVVDKDEKWFREDEGRWKVAFGRQLFLDGGEGLIVLDDSCMEDERIGVMNRGRRWRLANRGDRRCGSRVNCSVIWMRTPEMVEVCYE